MKKFSEFKLCPMCNEEMKIKDIREDYPKIAKKIVIKYCKGECSPLESYISAFIISAYENQEELKSICYHRWIGEKCFTFLIDYEKRHTKVTAINKQGFGMKNILTISEVQEIENPYDLKEVDNKIKMLLLFS